MRFGVLALIACAALAQPAGSVLRSITVEGNAEFSSQAVARATGLTVGAPATNQTLEAGCGRLMATGMFYSCQYKWQSQGGGLYVTYQVGENEPTQAIRFDIPELDVQKLLDWAKADHLLLAAKMPSNSEATEHYLGVIRAYLSSLHRNEQIVARTEGDLSTGEMITVFRPASLPKVVQMRFTGNANVPVDRLVSAMAKPALGSEYTEHNFRKLLGYNVQPIYEELGRLNVQFRKVEAQGQLDGVVVTTHIDEGAVFQLSGATVRVDGTAKPVEGFPIGKVANWRAILDVVDDAVRRERNEGYLAARANVERALNHADRTATVTADITRGVQYIFGKVEIQGLAGETLARAQSFWELKAGDPMRERYPSDFIDKVFRLGQLGPAVRTASSHLDVRPNTNVVDVVVSFR